MTTLRQRARQAVRDEARIWLPPDDRMDLQPVHYTQDLPSLATIEGLLRDGWRPGTEAEMRIRMDDWRDGHDPTPDEAA